MTEEQIEKGLECCVNFICGKCPYEYLESSTYPLRCIHALIQDLYKERKKKNENQV